MERTPAGVLEISAAPAGAEPVSIGNPVVLARRLASPPANFHGPSGTRDAHPASATRRYTDPASAPAGRIDLLTAILHEMGHALGLEDTYAEQDRDSLMYGFLTTGERRLPAKGQAAGATPHAEAHPHFLGTPLNIGDLPAGKAVTITYVVTINAGTTAISTSNQGTVSGSNIASKVTNDPQTGAADDATVTPIHQPPVVTNIAPSVNEDAVLTFSAASFDAGFSDPNAGDILQTVRVTSLPANGLLKLSGVNVTLNQDIPRAQLGNLTFTPTADYNGAASFNWNGSDGTLFAVSGAAVNITVNAVNDVPSFTKGADQTVTEDAAAQTVIGWATAISKGPADEAGQTVNFIVSNNNNPLFSAQPAVSATGDLTYTPATNANGTAVVSVQIHDNGGGTDTSAIHTFNINVTAVNDKPTFTAANPPAVNEDAGAQTVTSWATFSAGPTNEAGQTVLGYSVSNVSNTGLFSAGPAVANNGNLTYTPAANANGTSTFQVTVQDNGGTPGVDTSDPQTFTITVNPVNDNPTAANDTLVRYPSQSVKVRITTLLSNDTDPELNPLNLTAVGSALPAGATVTQDGSWVYYTPPAGSTSAGSFTYTISDGQGGTANGLVNVNIIVDNSAGQNITKIETLGDGSKRLTFGGIPGRTYRVQSTDSLAPATWVDRSTVPADAQGNFQFTDPIPLPPTRFYRSVSP